MSELSDKFSLYWHTYLKGPVLTPEHRFSEGRRWRFDFAMPAIKVAFEVEGLVVGFDKKTGKPRKSRHTTTKGYSDDCEKYNEAVKLGWRVLRFTSSMITANSIQPAVIWASRQLEDKARMETRLV